MPISVQEQRRRAQAAKDSPTPVQTYVILDEHFRPNAHGLGGVKSFVKSGKHCLVMTERQAQYWLDQGVIELEKAAEPEEK